MRIQPMPGARMLAIVATKLIAPTSDEIAEDVQAEDPEVLAAAGRVASVESGA